MFVNYPTSAFFYVLLTLNQRKINYMTSALSVITSRVLQDVFTKNGF